MQDVDSPVEKFRLLIQQHNEHRIIVPRLITWLDYKIEGTIHWRTLIILGSVLWVAVLWFFWKGVQSKGLPLWMFLPVPFILLHPQYHDNVTWAISILQQSVIIFWFGLLCYLLSKKIFGWALLVAIVATFTHGNGIFSFVIGIIFLSLDRNWKGVTRWTIALVLVATVYFWGFTKGQNADFQESLSDPVRLVMSFFALFGSLAAIKFFNPNYSALFGLFFVVVLGYYLLPKLVSHFRGQRGLLFFDKLLLGNVFFLGITAALISISRSWSGIENVISPRYQHYSSFVACWVYIVLLIIFTGSARKIFATLTIGAALLFNGMSYFIYNNEVSFRQQWLIADTENWRNHHTFLYYARRFNENIREPYTEAVAKGICELGPRVLAAPAGGERSDRNVRLSISRTTIEEKDASGTFPRENLIISNDEIAGKSYLYLVNGTEKGYWVPTANLRTSLWTLLTSQQADRPGFTTMFMTENFPPGDYRIGLLNGGKFTWTSSMINIKAYQK